MKLKTIYEYFKDYSESDIDKAIESLSKDEKELINLRYGNDLYNPITSEKWDKEKTDKFYGNLIPKLKRILNKMKKTNEKEKNEIHTVSQAMIKLPSNNDLFLLQDLKSGMSNIELCRKYNISPTVLYNILLKIKDVGINLSRKYYSNGEIKYKSISNLSYLNTNNRIGQTRTIITDHNETELKFLVISDLHFGNKLERLDIINRAFNYCVKNNVNSILCGGDFIDGTFFQGEQKISDIYKQIEYFLNNYPYDKNILTYGVGGDHDMSAFNDYSVNLIDICNNMRHDIIIGGFNNSLINIKNDKIHLYHHIKCGELFNTNSPIILHGHSHKYTTNILNNVLNVTIPSLSDINMEIPSALELNVTFKNGFIDKIFIKHILFAEKDILVSENIHNVNNRNNLSITKIKNEENYIEESNDTTSKLLKKAPTHK